MRAAQENGAESEVLNVIEAMPDDDYGNLADVMKAYGEVSAEGVGTIDAVDEGFDSPESAAASAGRR